MSPFIANEVYLCFVLTDQKKFLCCDITAFGQSSNSPFGSQSVFGQTNNPTNNPFAPKPFGSPNPFGSQSGGSIFGGTSTGVFGAPQASTPTFGSSSSPAFGTSTPAFGASTPAFGSGSSSFGGSSLFGQQKPAFGGFGSTPSQSSPFGSTFQQPQTQAAFGSNLFGSSTPFGGASQPAFGASSSPAFGATSSPAFGATTTPAFGAASTPAFGSTTTPAFGSTGSAFGVSSAPAFGSGGTFGASSNPAFGASSTSAFGTSSTPAFGSSATPAFGAPTTPSFSFGSSPAFGQSTSVFGSSPFGSTPSPSPFGAQSSAFGSQTTTPTFGTTTFGQSSFGGQQRGGSRVAAYTPTAEQDGATGTQAAGKLESISAMPVYKDKSHEELRWEDYQLGDKGGPNPAGQSAAAGSGIGTSAPSNPFGTSFNQSSPNPFSSTTASNPFAAKTPAFNNPSSTSSFSSSPFGASSAANPFGTTNPSPAPFGAAANPFGGTSTSTSIFGAPNTSSAFQSSPSPFGTSSASGTTSTFGGNTQTAGLFQTTSTLTQQNSTGGFGQTTSPFGQNATPSFTQSNLFSTPSTNFGGNLFNSTPAANNSIFGQTTSTQPTQTGGSLFGNFGQTQQTPAPTGGFGGGSSLFGQGAFGQSTANQSGAVAVQPAPVATNPFGTLPAMPQISIARAGSTPSIQYGISNMPVADKPAPVRVSSLLTSRHLSQRRIRLPARKYHPKKDGSRVPFFSDDEEAASTPKADALFIPRENPRALVIRPTEQWASRSVVEKAVLPRDTNTSVHENGKISGKETGPGLNGSNDQQKDKNNPAENGNDKERVGPTKHNHKANGIHEDHSAQKGDSYITLTGHRAGEAAIVYEHGADIEALMPKLRHSDYYTEPRVQELAAKERAEPGFCRRVKDFVVGRHGFGSIKFMGETDVRRLDLEGLVQFNNREVIVYMDEGKKPPVGQGLNKPAEVTLLNIKCFDKKTGTQYTEGPKIEKYKEMLMKKARDQGAEFVSYDPLKGEWKFKVNHFSCYKLDDEEAAADLMGLGVSLVADN